MTRRSSCGRGTRTNCSFTKSFGYWIKSARCGTSDLMALLMGICILLFASIVVCFLLGYFYGVAQITSQPDYVYYYPRWEKQLNRSDPNEAEIMETREYQLRIPTAIYKNRLKAIEELTELLRNLTGEELLPEDAEITIYQEYQLSTRNCGHTFSEFRVRHGYDETGALIPGNSASADINNDAEPPTYKADALKWNLTVADGYKYEQKLEMDIHSSHRKYNRKAKVKDLPQTFRFQNCGEVAAMFPGAFKNGITHPEEHILQEGVSLTIWEYSFKGKMFFDIVKYKFAWTLYFLSADTALDFDAQPFPNSEFSIRVYSPGEGYGPWQYEALEYSASIYKKLLDYYDA